MAAKNGYADYVLEQLGALPGLRARRMFGGTGIYCDEIFFAIIADDSLYFKVGDRNRERYASRGMQPFRPYADKPEVSMSYFEVPPETIEEAAELLLWAQESVGVALAARQGRSTRKRKSRPHRKDRE